MRILTQQNPSAVPCQAAKSLMGGYSWAASSGRDTPENANCAGGARSICSVPTPLPSLAFSALHGIPVTVATEMRCGRRVPSLDLGSGPGCWPSPGFGFLIIGLALLCVFTSSFLVLF